MVLLLTGCASSGAATNYCDLVRPVYISQQDSLTDGTARQILTHNETWARVCRK
jgi:hypothetical protein